MSVYKFSSNNYSHLSNHVGTNQNVWISEHDVFHTN